MDKIIANISNRTGNQLFRYAYARKLQQTYGGQLFLNFLATELMAEREPAGGWEEHLSEFKLADFRRIELGNRQLARQFFRGWQKLAFYLYLFLAKIFPKKMRSGNQSQNRFLIRFFCRKGLYIFPFVDMKSPLQPRQKTVYLDLPAENADFYLEMAPVLRQEIRAKTSLSPENQAFLKRIQQTNSVCVTIRRGDYLSSQYQKDFFVTDEAYFSRGIAVLKEKINQPVFFFFSDDVSYIHEFTEKYLTAADRYEMEAPATPIADKLTLMSSCKHFIISNSTFSWWAQFLGSNPDKVVIGPKSWHPVGSENTNNLLIQDNWIKFRRQESCLE